MRSAEGGVRHRGRLDGGEPLGVRIIQFAIVEGRPVLVLSTPQQYDPIRKKSGSVIVTSSVERLRNVECGLRSMEIPQLSGGQRFPRGRDAPSEQYLPFGEEGRGVVSPGS